MSPPVRSASKAAGLLGMSYLLAAGGRSGSMASRVLTSSGLHDQHRDSVV